MGFDPVSAGLTIGTSLLGGALGGNTNNEAIYAARQAADVQQRNADKNSAMLMPFITGGQKASFRLSQLLGLDNFDRDEIAKELARTNPDLFATKASLISRPRDPNGSQYARFGPGTEYMINGKSVETPTGYESLYTDDQNKAIDDYISGLKTSGDYGKLTKNFTMNDYVEDPGYKFRLEQGEKGLDRAASKRGNFFSGAALKAADSYNSNMASQEYGNARNRFVDDQNSLYNRLAGIQNSGQQGVNAGVNNNNNNANQQGTILGQAANASTAQSISNNNNFSQSLSNLLRGNSSYGSGSSGNVFSGAGDWFRDLFKGGS